MPVFNYKLPKRGITEFGCRLCQGNDDEPPSQPLEGPYVSLPF